MEFYITTMPVPEKVDRIKVCEPIKRFLAHALDLGFHIEMQELQDYHFNELHFVIKSSEVTSNVLPLTEGISNPKVDIFTCDCHWSTVEVAK